MIVGPPSAPRRPYAVSHVFGPHPARLLRSPTNRGLYEGIKACFPFLRTIDELSAAAREGRLSETLAPYVQPHVLVIDEVGYLTYSADAANVLFQVVDHRYLHKKPMLFTTNKPLSQWGRVLHDPDLAEAITDRVLERGRFIQLCGPSYRTRHLKGAEHDGDQPADAEAGGDQPCS